MILCLQTYLKMRQSGRHGQVVAISLTLLKQNYFLILISGVNPTKLFWGNIIWALKQIQHGKLKILFGRLKHFLGQLIKLFGAELQKLEKQI